MSWSKNNLPNYEAIRTEKGEGNKDVRAGTHAIYESGCITEDGSAYKYKTYTMKQLY